MHALEICQSTHKCLKVGLKIHKGKTKYMTNYADSEYILTDRDKIEETKIQIPRTNSTPQGHYKLRNLCQDQSRRGAVLKKKEIR